ncbi:MAG: hypothetical protein MI742_16165 [Desulfobacterales bacterium]|nr:hypothetical protein [Desulfobacterales bacterium]
MKERVSEIMQKIGLLEKDLDLQKHILKATPTGSEDQARETLATISHLKEKIEAYRQEIKAIDPEEYEQMIRFEASTARFKEEAKGRDFVSVTDLNTSMECQIEKKDGTMVQCLVKAQDATGEWLIMTVDGEVMALDAESVVS